MRREVIVGAISIGVICAWLALSWPALVMRWGSPQTITAYLLRRTPVGSDVLTVRRWLAERGALLDERGLPQVRPAVREAVLDDSMLHPDYFYEVQARLASYDWLFQRRVTATFRFDRTNHLTGVRVRLKPDTTPDAEVN
jgi:hypothetical protein